MRCVILRHPFKTVTHQPNLTTVRAKHVHNVVASNTWQMTVAREPTAETVKVGLCLLPRMPLLGKWKRNPFLQSKIIHISFKEKKRRLSFNTKALFTEALRRRPASFTTIKPPLPNFCVIFCDALRRFYTMAFLLTFHRDHVSCIRLLFFFPHFVSSLFPPLLN